MPSVNAEFIERYQIEFERNPRSKVFAALAEAYRKMGLLDAAVDICKQGISHHPSFVSGRVAFAKVLLEKKAFAEALPHLQAAAQLSPDNILAHSLLAETLLQLKRPKEAWRAYKMVLFLNPHDSKAQAAVKKWEFLSADEYGADTFAMQSLDQVSRREESSPLRLERALSVADAFTVRNEIANALEVLEHAVHELGERPELKQRLQLLRGRQLGSSTPPPLPSQKPTPKKSSPSPKEQRLNSMLRRISERRGKR